jgi:hypothetical protein
MATATKSEQEQVNVVATVGRHKIVEMDRRYFLWTEGVGYWGFDFRTLEAAQDAAEPVK